MARQRDGFGWQRLTSVFRSKAGSPDAREVRRMEEKRDSLANATQQWLGLLREMESRGECSDARYERYFQAYLQAREQQKRVDLALFNLRNGFSS